MKKLLIVLFLLISTPAFSYETYYVRADGGTAVQCTGKADAAYDGSGTGEACAFKHPFYALGVPYHANDNIMVGGDTLIIKSGSYMMGRGFGESWGYCNDTSGTQNCKMDNIPSGPNASNPTKIYGEGWDTGCADPPELWGTQKTYSIINLNDSSNVEVKCLEITDHASCGVSASTRAGVFPSPECSNSWPYGDWGQIGVISNGTSSSNVLLQDLNIHGLSELGLWAGRLTDWTLRRVRIYSNGVTGWNGDPTGTPKTSSGTITLDHVTIQYNGCVESYPGLVPGNCTGQGDGGGNGDGVGFNSTGGNFIITDSNISWNTQDGLDLLYHRLGGTITIKRSWFEGNAGNQVKTAGDANIENSMMIGNCDYYALATSNSEAGAGASKRATGATFGNCRAYGATVAANFPKDTFTIKNSTLTGQGSMLLEISDDSSAGCDGTEVFQLYNNVFMGNTCGSWCTLNPRDVALIADDGTDGSGSGNCGPSGQYSMIQQLEEGNNIVFNTKDNVHFTGTGDLNVNPLMVDSALDGDVGSAYLTASSPARDTADETISISNGNDVNNFARGASWDMGGLEYGSTPPAPSCLSQATLCESQGTCEAAGWYWQLNGSCQDTIDPCIDSAVNCTNQSNCETANWYWWSTNVCHNTTEPQPPGCDDDCTLCNAGNCVSTGPSCFLQLDNTCKATIDPCNASCGGCTTGNCTSSTFAGGCTVWTDNVCHPGAETCDDTCSLCASDILCAGSNKGCTWSGLACENTITCQDNYIYCLTREDCEAQGHSWWTQNTCRVLPQGKNTYHGTWRRP